MSVELLKIQEQMGYEEMREVDNIQLKDWLSVELKEL